ncbi:MAG: hypothetical protein HYW06_06195 [Gemmatimonadetes bacterium]|nr:hypothetical protein [Gemmatimonadota bacterium]
MPDNVIEGWVNPLAFLEVDEPWASTLRRPVTADTVLAFACPPGTPSDVQSVTARYREISNEAVRLFIVPAEQRLIERLVWPLRSAKAAYMLGNYLATIALSWT